jgi:peptidoglycan hydrolase-like protein with peptidoglycan-binding domain
MRVLEKGMHGPDSDVEKWQLFLIGQNFLYKGEADGKFGAKTDKATRKFQEKHGLYVDGQVGPKTYGMAMTLGFHATVITQKDKSQTSKHWPPRPTPNVLRPMTYAEREKAFGVIQWVHTPTSGNPEAVKVTNNFMNNITGLVVPQLKYLAKEKPGKYRGFPKSGKIFVHKVLQDSILELYQAIEDEGKLDLIETFGGSFSMRLVRGSRTTLSNHARGAALDHNAYPWNGLGCTPALAGKPGSLREIVPIFQRLKWWWGGWGWPKKYHRLDGMHNEASYQLAVKLGVL